MATMANGLLPRLSSSREPPKKNALVEKIVREVSAKNIKATIEKLVSQVEKIETAIEPLFQEHFVAAMAIPHKTADYTHLRKVVDLPPPKLLASPGASRSRAKRR